MTESEFEFPRTGIVLPEYTNQETDQGDWLVEFAVDAVNTGFESVWASESWGYDPFTILGRIAERTECALGTCIANAFARSPASLAASSLALHNATDGRFVLGIGASTPRVVEGFHGRSYERPIRRIREIIEILNLALSGEPIDYDGDVFELSGFVLNNVDDATVPVLNAALGQTNIAMTIDYADGLLPHLMPLPAIEDAIAAARNRAYCDRDIHVAPSVPTIVSDDPDEARQILSRHIAYYAGSTEFYNDVIATHGFADEAAQIQTHWRDGDRDCAAAAVTTDLREALGIAGTAEYARERVLELQEGFMDTVIISFPRGVSDGSFRATIEALPPES